MNDNIQEKKDVEPPKYSIQKFNDQEIALNGHGNFNGIPLKYEISSDQNYQFKLNINDFIAPEYIVESIFVNTYISKDFLGTTSTVYSKDNIQIVTVQHNIFEKYEYDKLKDDYILGLDYLVIIPACLIFSLVITAFRKKFFQ